VLIAQRWILARLRNTTSFSLDEINEHIALLVADLNSRVMKRYGTSRRPLFEEIDRPELTALGEAIAAPRERECLSVPRCLELRNGHRREQRCEVHRGSTSRARLHESSPVRGKLGACVSRSREILSFAWSARGDGRTGGAEQSNDEPS